MNRPISALVVRILIPVMVVYILGYWIMTMFGFG